ncbi:hypothetical protein [Erythrobacter alti]|uniref:hypothetical protein n=1 Tax=Erythrobacter alti TaxID=1896145 RepID=UPI0030F45FDC
METPFETGSDRYRKNAAYIYARSANLRFDQRRLASLVGYVAFGLPILLIIGSFFTEHRTSISHYYYEPFLLGDVFVGALIFVGALLLTYRGWTPSVAQLATVAGVAATGVAMFPTRGWQAELVPAWLEAVSPWLHLGSAAALFGLLAFFCFFVFTKVDPDQMDNDLELCRSKRARDRIYRICGTVILAAMAAIGIGLAVDQDRASAFRLVFWGETLALFAFGVSWMTQGRLSGTILMDPADIRDRNIAHKREELAEIVEDRN